jgi:hypothetical protein
MLCPQGITGVGREGDAGSMSTISVAANTRAPRARSLRSVPRDRPRQHPLPLAKAATQVKIGDPATQKIDDGRGPQWLVDLELEQGSTGWTRPAHQPKAVHNRHALSRAQHRVRDQCTAHPTADDRDIDRVIFCQRLFRQVHVTEAEPNRCAHP